MHEIKPPKSRTVFLLTDQVDQVADTHQAFEALEHLVTPVGAQCSEKLELDRSQLGALLRTLNRSMRVDIETAQQLSCEMRQLKFI
jgi:hypothetical protein